MDLLLLRRDVGQVCVGATAAKADQSFDSICFSGMAECVEGSAVDGTTCYRCVSTALMGDGLVVDARDCVWCGAGHERHLLTDGFQVHGVFLEEMFVQGFLISILGSPIASNEGAEGFGPEAAGVCICEALFWWHGGMAPQLPSSELLAYGGTGGLTGKRLR